MCDCPDHFASKCPNRKGKKSANMVISEAGGTSGYGNLLPTGLSVLCSPEWWMDTGLIFMFVLIFLCFFLTRPEGLPPC